MAATSQAEQIIAAATQEAKEILNRAHTIRSDAESALQEAAEKQQLLLQQALEEETRNLQKQAHTAISTMLDELKKETEGAVSSVVTDAGKQLDTVQHQLVATLALEQKKMQAGLEGVRRKKIHSLTATLQKEIPVIVKKVVGRSLALADHEALVREALDDAKHDTIWT
tara:strand:+ start:233 stop:739 length:507 start_codon:yes stop_codon:yes gene_type:complete